MEVASNLASFLQTHRYTDMESEDYHFYQGLVYLLENDVSTLGYDLTFSTEVTYSSFSAKYRVSQNPLLWITT